MNVIFLSPNFPFHFFNFCQKLKDLGCNVLGIGDCAYDNLDISVKNSLTEYYYVNSLEDYDQVMRAVAFFTFKYGKIDHIESQNEYWLDTEARLREDFNVKIGFRSSDLKKVRCKHLMKEGYAKANIKAARYYLIKSKEEALKFAQTIGFPLIVKPDSGVGASDTHKIDNQEQLQSLLSTINIRKKSYIMEEFVPGHVETFDGITDVDGNILFCTGQVMAVTPLDMLNGIGENISYTQNVQQTDLLEVGTRAVKAFGTKQRFFHFEFFRLDVDKQGLGNKGELIGLEVNMRAPGGYIPDKMNYAYDVDVYKIWAESIVFNQNRSFPQYSFKRYVTHYGRGANTNYKYSAEQIREKYSNDILLEKIPPKSIAGGMGAQVFVIKSDSVEQLKERGEYILAK